MAFKKKVSWNAGQVPERISQPRMPVYVMEPEIRNEDLRDAWSGVHIGQMCLALNVMFAHQSNDNFPHPVMYGGEGGWGSKVNVVPGQVMIYLGHTHVSCIGAKGRIIKKPYAAVFLNGIKFLIADLNNLKPILE
jgi:hypothetical protein